MSLPVQPAHTLDSLPTDSSRWLIEGLWAEQAVGIIGGEPKSGKSFLVLDMAVALASGTACLGRFAVPKTARVLLFSAEDPPALLRSRLDGICQARHACLAQLDIQVITAPYLWLDLAEDRKALTDTVRELQPKLLLLDPFVRLHRIDENNSSEVAGLLGFLRHLQREFHLAVALVHHTRKAAHHLRAGQALRGSSDLHAWGDSNLYLRRHAHQLTLTLEHRAAPGSADIPLRLDGENGALALSVAENSPQLHSPVPSSSAIEHVRLTLAQAQAPLSFHALRQACRIRTASLCQALHQLQRQRLVLKTPLGFRLAP